MPMLADEVDHVIGVDTHRDSNTAAFVEAATGAVLADLQCATDALGYKKLLAFANRHSGPSSRVWAIEVKRPDSSMTVKRLLPMALGGVH